MSIVHVILTIYFYSLLVFKITYPGKEQGSPILKNGDGKQENERRNIDYMLSNIDNKYLQIDIDINSVDSTLLYFKARFLAVLLEYRQEDGSNKGISISTL